MNSQKRPDKDYYFTSSKKNSNPEKNNAYWRYPRRICEYS